MQPENLSHICPICSSNQVNKIISWNNYVISECKTCELIYSDPMPSDEDLMEFYQGFLFNKPKKKYLNKEVAKRKKELIKLFDFNPKINVGKFLDYGAGTGVAYKAACDLGLEVFYNDLDEIAKNFAQKEYGLKDEFIVSDLTSTTISFDYVLSDNVIEHLKDPVSYISKIKDVLNKNGTIIIKTPHAKNTESFFNPLLLLKVYFFGALKNNSIREVFKAFNKRFWHCDPPRHLFSFTKVNLNIAAQKAGFNESQISISYYNLPLYKHSFFEYFIFFIKNLNFKNTFFILIIVPILPLEFVLKIFQIILLRLKLISPGGIILKLTETDLK